MKRQTLIPRSFALLVIVAGLTLIPATLGVLLVLRSLTTHRSSDTVLEGYSDFFAALRDTQDSEERIRFVTILQAMRKRFHARTNMLPTTHIDLWIVDKNGNVRATTSVGSPPVDWATISLPTNLTQSRELKFPRFSATRLMLWRLPGEIPEYLIYRRTFRIRQWAPHIVMLGFLVSIVPVFLCGLVVIYYVRKKERIALNVIRDLRGGNLKARFPVKRFDEVGRMMHAFNEMADDIESLVDRVRGAELSRKNLLQELAHDVRTPLASLDITISTLWKKRKDLPLGYLTENLNYIRQEVDYFRRLIEDLFLLAEVNRPNYAANAEEVNPVDVLLGEIKTVGESSKSKKKIRFRVSGEKGDSRILRTDPFLIRRLFRNLLENARRFAERNVTIVLEERRDSILFSIRDDGPGFTAESLQRFGERRESRFLDTSGDGKLSLGLGSVIVKTIVSVHGGTLLPGNWLKPDGSVGGGQVKVSLPVEMSHSLIKKAS